LACFAAGPNVDREQTEHCPAKLEGCVVVVIDDVRPAQRSVELTLGGQVADPEGEDVGERRSHRISLSRGRDDMVVDVLEHDGGTHVGDF